MLAVAAHAMLICNLCKARADLIDTAHISVLGTCAANGRTRSERRDH
jgi:hypothetical protein